MVENRCWWFRRVDNALQWSITVATSSEWLKNDFNDDSCMLVNCGFSAWWWWWRGTWLLTTDNTREYHYDWGAKSLFIMANRLLMIVNKGRTIRWHWWWMMNSRAKRSGVILVAAMVPDHRSVKVSGGKHQAHEGVAIFMDVPMSARVLITWNLPGIPSALIPQSTYWGLQATGMIRSLNHWSNFIWISAHQDLITMIN